MDNQPHESADSTANSTPHNLESHSQGSVMFSGNQAFTVNGGTFTSVTNQCLARVPSDFRMIPLGDIDLRHEIQVDQGVVGRRRGQGCIRRVYSAKVQSRKSDFTVAMYQGDGAEEDWRQAIAEHVSIRHPNIIQIYGTVHSGGIYATLYHDELVPFRQFLDSYRYSHFATVYFYACCRADFLAAENYVNFTFQQPLGDNYTAWIRRSSGQLCAELIPSDTLPPVFHYYPLGILCSHRISSASDTELMVVESLTMEEYHDICFLNLSQFRKISIFTSTTVNLGAIIACSSGDPLEGPVEIAYTPNVDFCTPRWQTTKGAERVVMENGWARFKFNDVFNDMFKLDIWYTSSWGPWLSQANHIFQRLRIMSNFDDCVLVCGVRFSFEILGNMEEPPAGFLFLCPLEDFKTSPFSYHWPDSHAFWSLDPSSADRLTLEEATRLGFPTFHCTTELFGHSWDDGVYKGLREFHQGKGFDPYTQDLTRGMKYPLYRLMSEVNEAEEDWDADDESNYMQTSSNSDADAPRKDDWDLDNESNYPQTSDDSNAEACSEEDDNNSDSTNCSFRRARAV
ncbi:hypothetical protein DFH08DRAFT_122002 [Mycena albidolilacea]|uniref:Protein kinase domain-containing protein n=1 Tax=Mycena albidolilacea TaxID=1033008 RepID=A0AAD6YX04_9AGAR|nr:hypothetical protein DFH08DRAFT_122002 [Mycena albidolilacea]